MLGVPKQDNPYEHKISRGEWCYDDCPACAWREWEATRTPAFRSRVAINRQRALHGDPTLSREEYREARIRYYQRNPTARAQDDEIKWEG